MTDPVKISVVVAVYNPGTDLEALVTSLLAQTMAAAEFEVIFVDDGSTDGSGERLDAFVLDHPTYRVMHILNSGWPGRPRNVGIDAATGAYVYIVDHDDWLGDEALERLYACAERNVADVVVGKEVGHGFGVPRHMFRTNVDDAKLGTAPLLALLTPHKLFRLSMLTEHAIRFPEGRRRLEDHVFVMQPLADDLDLHPGDLDVTDEIGGSTVTLILRNRTTDVQFDQPVPFVHHDIRSGLTMIEGSVPFSVDLESVAGGGRLAAGTWDIWVAVSSCGWSAEVRLADIGSPHFIGDGGVEAYVTNDGNLSIRIEGSPASSREMSPRPGLPPMPPMPPAETPPTAARSVLREGRAKGSSPARSRRAEGSRIPPPLTLLGSCIGPSG